MRRVLVMLLVSIGLLAIPDLSLAQPGDLDTAFGVDGLVVHRFRTNGAATSMTVADDGRIVVAGAGAKGYWVARYLPWGKPDPSFSEDGFLTFDISGGSAYDIALDDKARIVVLGDSFDPENDDPALTRVLADGTIDRSFGHAGVRVLNFVDGHENPTNLALMTNGKIVIGAQRGQHRGKGEVIRLTSDGDIDRSFGWKGRRVVAFDDADLGIHNIAAAPHGATMIFGSPIGGPHDGDIFTARLNRRGYLDRSFSSDGFKYVDMATTSTGVRDVSRHRGRWFLSGISGTSPDEVVYVECLSLDGSPDPTFGVNGLFSRPVNDREADGVLAVQSDGRPIVPTSYGGSILGPGDILLTRTDAMGQPDITLGPQGVVAIDLPGSASALAVAITKPGKLLLAGKKQDPAGSDQFAYVARFELR